jgi:hypothetical protein
MSMTSPFGAKSSSVAFFSDTLNLNDAGQIITTITYTARDESNL